MDTMQKPSRRLLWVGIVGVVIAIIIVVTAAFMFLGSSTKSGVATISSSPSEETVATKDEVKQNLATLDASIKQSATDQAAAKAALRDSEKQIKVGS